MTPTPFDAYDGPRLTDAFFWLFIGFIVGFATRTLLS